MPIDLQAARQVAVVPRTRLAGLTGQVDTAAGLPLADVHDLAPGRRGRPGRERLPGDLGRGKDGVRVAAAPDRWGIEEPGQAAPATERVDELEAVHPSPRPAT